MINNYDEYLYLLKEGLIMTHRISKYRNILDNFLIDYDYDLKISENDTFTLKLYEKDIDFYKPLFSIINNLGYFPSNIIINRNKKSFKYDFEIIKKEIKNTNFDNIIITLEAKFDIEIENVPDEIYHIYAKKYKDKIFKNGLIPKSRMRKSYHPERCYFTYTRIEGKNLIDKFKFVDKLYNINNEYDIMVINTKELNDVKFYNDPNSIGFYIYDNISPKNIIKKINK